MRHFIILSLSALLLSGSMPAEAQRYHYGRRVPPRHHTHHTTNHSADTYYGLRLGMGIANVNSDAPILDTNKSKTGLNVGVVLGTRLAPSAPLYFETGLSYVEKGGKSIYKGNKFTYGLNYVELPLVVKYKIDAGSDVTIEPLLGGYLACGVGGKIKDYDARAAYSSFSSDYSDNFRRFDGGLRVGCGLGYQMMYLEASYDIGLANVGKDSFEDTRTGTFNLTVGVNF